MNGTGGRSTWYEGRTYESLAMGGDTVKGTRHKTVEQTSDFDKYGVTRGMYSRGTDINNNDANS